MECNGRWSSLTTSDALTGNLLNEITVDGAGGAWWASDMGAVHMASDGTTETFAEQQLPPVEVSWVGAQGMVTKTMPAADGDFGFPKPPAERPGR